jgi:class 3 adenylate cyclase/tetratricopeptide (TPR) repeat protein
MKCPKCKHENASTANFCEECAAPLARTCLHCGTQVSAAARFCAHCGEPLNLVPSKTSRQRADKILPARAAIEDERKHVTALFADIKGSFELFADRDPEVVRKLFLDPVIERMMEAVHRYEGTVYSVMGDGIMAIFGAPLALEDHAVRACYAGLRMQGSVGRYAEEVQRLHAAPLAIRVGLASGEIVGLAIGNDLHTDYTVVGQTAWLASRLEQMATPGSVLTTADTLRLAEGYVAARPLGSVPVKGFPDPVEIYQVTGPGAAQNRLQANVRRGLTRFVGRDIELEQLFRALHPAANGSGQVVAIVGEPGMGKSRLVHEFLHSHHTSDWLVLESYSTSYGQATPYLPVIELLRRFCEISPHDSTQSIRAKVTDRIMTLDPSLRELIPPVLDLLDALDDDHPFRSLDPLHHRESTYQAVTHLLLSEKHVQPVIAVVENLHWNDALTIGVLNELVVGAQKARLLLLVSYRPDYRDEWMGRPNYHRVRLDPLAGEGLSELLEALLGSDPSLPPLKKFLVERASGNPFFVEEIVRTFVDSGVLEGARNNYRLVRAFSSSEVPPTVQAVLGARIDSLPAAEKRLLQEAAVIGYDAPFTLLQAISGLTDDRLRALLDHLQAAQFLYPTQLFPDLQYTFTHALTQDVTYTGVLRERRREIHGRVVDAIEQLYADRLNEQVDRLAHHTVRGELFEQAVPYLRQAGAKAAARSALAEARAWFEQALGALDALPESRPALEQAFEIRLELRQVLRQLGEDRQMLCHLREAEMIAERLKDDRRHGQVYAFMTTVLSTLDEVDEAVATGTRALEIAGRLGDLKLRVVATSYLEQPYYYRAEYDHVIDLAIGNIAALPADWIGEYFGMAVPASVFGRAWLIMSLAELGRFAEAAKYEAEAILIADPTQHAFTIAWAHFPPSMFYLLKGNWVTAHSHVERWIARLRDGNVAIQLPWAVASSGWALAQMGEANEALNRVQESVQLLEHQAARGIVAHRSWGYHAASRACLLIGRLDEALRLGECSLASARHQPGFAAHAQHLLGDIAANPDCLDAERGEVYYRKALAFAELHGMRPLVAHCHYGLGKLRRQTGYGETARDHLTTATTIYRELDMRFWLEQANEDMLSCGDRPSFVQPVVKILGQLP